MKHTAKLVLIACAFFAIISCKKENDLSPLLSEPSSTANNEGSGIAKSGTDDAQGDPGEHGGGGIIK